MELEDSRVVAGRVRRGGVDERLGLAGRDPHERLGVDRAGREARLAPAGVGSTFGISAASSARTHSQCWPESSASSSSTASHSSHVVGAAGGAPSPIAHSKDSTGSLLAKAKVTSGPEFTGSGKAVMNVSGGVVSSDPMISHS